MKKIFTLLFALGMFAFVQAQPGRSVVKVSVNPHPVYNNDIRPGNRFADERYLKMEIANINRAYDFKIQRVQNNFFMKRGQKKREIRFLERQRNLEINRAYAKFYNRYPISPVRRHY
jgi:hypothetical protein